MGLKLARQNISGSSSRDFRRFFGGPSTRLVLKYLLFKAGRDENSFNIEGDPQIFLDALNEFLGAGAVIVEYYILKNLYSKFGLEFKEKKNYNFSDYINELRKICER